MRKLLLAFLLILPTIVFAQGTTTQIRRGSTLPTTCGGGDIFMKSGTSAGFYFNIASGTCSWLGPAAVGGGTPGGSDKYCQFNDGGAFGGDINCQWDKTTHTLSLGNGSSPMIITARGSAGDPTSPGVDECAFKYNLTTGKMAFIDHSGGDCGPGSGTSGTVTHTGGALDLNSLMQGAGTDDAKVMASDPTQCSAGQAPTGIDKTGAAKGCFTPSGSGAPTTATYVTGSYDATLSAEHSNSTVYSSPDVNPSSAGTLDDEFDTTWNSGGVTWTWTNQGSATATAGNNGWAILTDPAHSSHSWKILTQPKPSGTWTVVAKFTPEMYPIGANQHFAGLCLRDSGTGKLVTFAFMTNGVAAQNLEIDYWTNATTYSSTPVTTSFTGTAPIWFKIADDSTTNFTFSVSRDGVSYKTWVQTLGRTAFLAAPDQVGMCFETTNSSVDAVMDVDYFRRIN